MAHAQKLYAAKNRLVAGRDPILPACLRAKSPSGLRGSRPATGHLCAFTFGVLRTRIQDCDCNSSEIVCQYLSRLERTSHASTETT